MHLVGHVRLQTDLIWKTRCTYMYPVYSNASNATTVNEAEAARAMSSAKREERRVSF